MIAGPTVPCPYCGGGGPFTREHIWPAAFLRRYRPELSYSRRANRTFRGDMQIRDVCADCNNGVLSMLDNYATTLFDQYFAKGVADDKSVDFRYDHSLLMRWLLKISFNSSRTTGEDAPSLAVYAEAIAAKTPVSPCFCAAWVNTVAPAIRYDDRGQRHLLKPRGYRCAQMRLTDGPMPAIRLRLVMVNAYRFVIAIGSGTTVTLDDFTRVTASHGGIPLMPSGRSIVHRPTIDTRAAWDGAQHWPVARS